MTIKQNYNSIFLIGSASVCGSIHVLPSSSDSGAKASAPMLQHQHGEAGERQESDRHQSGDGDPPDHLHAPQHLQHHCLLLLS